MVSDLRKRLLDANEVFLKTVGGREFFTSGEYRSAIGKRREAIVRIAGAIDRLLNVIRLLQTGSAMTPMQRLLGLSRSSGTDAIAARIQVFFTDIDKRTAALQKLK